MTYYSQRQIYFCMKYLVVEEYDPLNFQ